MDTSVSNSRLFSLPPELRNIIYDLLSAAWREHDRLPPRRRLPLGTIFRGRAYPHPALLASCKKIRAEFLPIFSERNAISKRYHIATSVLAAFPTTIKDVAAILQYCTAIDIKYRLEKTNENCSFCEVEPHFSLRMALEDKVVSGKVIIRRHRLLCKEFGMGTGLIMSCNAAYTAFCEVVTAGKQNYECGMLEWTWNARI